MKQKNFNYEDIKLMQGISRLFKDSVFWFSLCPNNVVNLSFQIKTVSEYLNKSEVRMALIYSGKFSALNMICEIYKLYDKVSLYQKNSYISSIFSQLQDENSEVRLKHVPGQKERNILDDLSYYELITLNNWDGIVIRPTKYGKFFISMTVDERNDYENLISSGVFEIVGNSLNATKSIVYDFNITEDKTQINFISGGNHET